MNQVSATNSANIGNAAVAEGISPQTPSQLAQSLVSAHSDPRGGINYAALKRDLASISARNPELGAQVSHELRALLGPNSFARMEMADFALIAKDGKGITISDNAPSLQSYYDGTANRGLGKTVAERAGIRAGDLAHYARLDRMWGDGNPRSFEPEAINSGIADLIASGMSLEDYEKSRSIASAQAPSVQGGQPVANNAELIADIAQMTLDITGIVEPTPVSDGLNTLISVGRGLNSAWNGDWSKAGEHGLNGVISVAGILPYAGDLAKAGKLGKWAETITKAVNAAIDSPAARKALEPALRKLHDTLGAIPDAVWNKMPENLRSTLEGIKGKLDELFGAAAARVDDAVASMTARYPELSGARDVAVRTAEEANEPFVAKGWQPPYSSGTQIAEFTTTSEMRFVRVHGPDNKARSWMMRAEDIQGLSPAQIKDKFALPDLPSFVSDVNVPTGTRVRVGEVAPQANWGGGGATQFELLGRLAEEAFTNTRRL